jgi:hypothetical protein
VTDDAVTRLLNEQRVLVERETIKGFLNSPDPVARRSAYARANRNAGKLFRL